MGKEQSYQNAAKEILRLIGGKENVISAAHCATRLRLVLKNEKLADVDGILNTELVKGQFATGGQFQIIIGSGTVDEVYKYFIQYAELQESSKKEVKQAADQKMNPLQRLVKMLADVFVPIIPALVASGLLMGLNNVLTAQGLFAAGKSLVDMYPQIADAAAMINTFASAAYAFLPILLGFSATKMFGGNPYLGAVMGMIMVSGDLLNAYAYGSAITENTVPVWEIGALTIEKVGYQGTVLPVLAVAAILAFLEKKLHKTIPEYLDNLLTPALSILITAFLTFTVVGGVMRTAGDWITNGVLWLHDSLGAVGGFIFGFIFLTLLCGISVRRKNPAVKIILGVIGLLICHLLGAVQYAVLAHITIGASLVAVSLPYIVKDVISVVGAYLVAIAVRKALYAGNILQDAKAA